MFFNNRKETALKGHEQAVKEMEEVYAAVIESASELNKERDLACKLIRKIEFYINNMARTPKKLDRKLGEISVEMKMLKKTEEYAQEAYDAAVKSGVFTATGATAGIGMTVISASDWQNLTTTFGRENADKVIKALSNAKAKSSIVKSIGAKIGRNLGKIGIGVTVGALTIGMTYVSYKNYNIANQLTEGTIKVDLETNHLRKKQKEIDIMKKKISKLNEDLRGRIHYLKVLSEKYGDYIALSKQSKQFLIAYINDTHTLAELLNKDIK